MDQANQPDTTTPLQLMLAWGFVGIPLVLGGAANPRPSCSASSKAIPPK